MKDDSSKAMPVSIQDCAIRISEIEKKFVVFFFFSVRVIGKSMKVGVKVETRKSDMFF